MRYEALPEFLHVIGLNRISSRAHISCVRGRAASTRNSLKLCVAERKPIFHKNFLWFRATYVRILVPQVVVRSQNMLAKIVRNKIMRARLIWWFEYLVDKICRCLDKNCSPARELTLNSVSYTMSCCRTCRVGLHVFSALLRRGDPKNIEVRQFVGPLLIIGRRIV